MLICGETFFTKGLCCSFKCDSVEMSATLPHLSHPRKQRATLTKQSSVHQAKVSSWLHSSGDMDKCCKGWYLFYLSVSAFQLSPGFFQDLPCQQPFKMCLTAVNLSCFSSSPWCLHAPRLRTCSLTIICFSQRLRRM